MKPLLSDHVFSDTLRYENHRLIYGTTVGDRIDIGGFLAAAVLGALLYGQDEGRERDIAINQRDGRYQFFRRYEDETLHDNGGLFRGEVQALSDAYVELDGDLNKLLAICGNDRLYDLAFGLMVDYMEYLVEEQVGQHIYDIVPWAEPFAQWLYNAGYVETRRQYLLSIDWDDPAVVYTLAEELNNPSLLANSPSPSFIFQDERAEDLLNGYYTWLVSAIEQQASVYPDAKAQLAMLKDRVFHNELDWDFIKPEMKDFTPEQLNLFRKWMNQWTAFVEVQIQPATSKQEKKEEEQLFFPDGVFKCPTEDMKEKYAAAREYIKERKKYDENFRKFVKKASYAELGRQLTMLFGWYVDPDPLRKSMLRKPKQKTKKYT